MDKLRIFSTFGLAATALVSASGAASAHPDPATPLNNPASWVTFQDYPTEALRAGQQGMTRFTLRIAGDGSVTECKVTQSSGSGVLDAKACDLLVQRARFRAATDPSGKPIEGSWSSSIRWMIPNDKQPPQPFSYAYSMRVGLDGAVTDCRMEPIEGSSSVTGKNNGQTAPCSQVRFSGPYRDQSGKPVVRRVRFTTRVEVLEDKSD